MRIATIIKNLFLIIALLCMLLNVSCTTTGSEADISTPGEKITDIGTGAPATDDTTPSAAETTVDGDLLRPHNTDMQVNEPGGTADEPFPENTASDQHPEQESSPGREAETTTVPPLSAEPTPPSALPSQAPGDNPVVLIIFGEGVSGETTWTLDRLEALQDGYREYKYSTTNNWPSYGYATAHGISLPYLLRQAGLRDNAAGFKLTATDGYHVTVTYDQMFGAQYSYANHSRAGSSGASAVEPVVAWEWGDDAVRPENIRSFFGQQGPQSINTSTFVQDLCKIEVLTVSPGRWAAPDSSIVDGSEVSFGTELFLMHDDMDNIRIYYTLDGSEPDYSSHVYNLSASYFQPHLTVPLFLTESLIVKAFAAGYGRDPSPVVTLSITVQNKE